ncbi:MAG TPA: ATPase domain-containing protein [Clostridia bacterium]|nr:ATPase domain-containing protein [Clostridia bacterium]
MNKRIKSEALAKSSTGIAGFDRLAGGGLPQGRVSLVLGNSGSGKTIFALQTLVNRARRGEPGIFVSFNEQPQHLVENNSSFGWDLKELEKGRLVFLDARMPVSVAQAGEIDVSGMIAGLRAIATEIGAKHIVMDSIDVLLTVIDDPSAELRGLFRLVDWLLEKGVSGLITANLTTEPRSEQRLAFLQSISDCTVSLDSRLRDRMPARYLRILKYRGSSFSEEETPFVIGDSGIEVALPRHAESTRVAGSMGSLHPEIELARQQLTARVQALDRFLEMKQAELDFLAEKQSTRTGSRETARTATPGRRAIRGSTKNPVQKES